MATANTSRQQRLSVEGYCYGELMPLVEVTLKAGVSVLLRGHPGVGKSSMATRIAQRMNLPLVDIRLAQRDPAELAGVYFPDRKRKVLSLFPPEWVRAACDGPTFVFLDEINAGVTRLHQAAAYQIVLEHRVGPFQFHPGTVVMAAGNLEEDNAIVSVLSSALCNRFAHFILKVDADSWLAWAAENSVPEPIQAYIARHGEAALYDNNGEYAFASPRSWEMAGRVTATCPEELSHRAVASCVGLEAAEKLDKYLRIYRKVNAQKIVEKGRTQDFTKGKKADPSFIYAAVFSVAAWLVRNGNLKDKHLPNIVAFMNSPGLDVEYTFLFLRQLKQANGVLTRLKAVPEFRELASQLANLHLGMYK